MGRAQARAGGARARQLPARLVRGIDRAPGEDGKGSIYNDKIGYSFAIGHSFLNSAGP